MVKGLYRQTDYVMICFYTDNSSFRLVMIV